MGWLDNEEGLDECCNRYHAGAMFDIPPNRQVLAVLDGLNNQQA